MINHVIETCFFYYPAVGLLNRFLWMQRRNPLCSDDMLLFKTSVSFVDHLQEFLSAVLTSTTLIIPPKDWRANPASLANLIKVTLPSYIHG
jgi:acyl-CoA synthetase